MADGRLPPTSAAACQVTEPACCPLVQGRRQSVNPLAHPGLLARTRSARGGERPRAMALHPRRCACLSARAQLADL